MIAESSAAGELAQTSTRQRVDAVDWARIRIELDEQGCALTPPLVTPADADTLAGCYSDAARFRSTIDMARFRFGRGQYRYFNYPLPRRVAELRQALYPHLLPIAQDWHARLGRPTPWPATLPEWLDSCHAAGQVKPTPLLLKYGAGDWNALHRDLYGELYFPLQVVINLTDPGTDHTGGEFLLVEQRLRAGSRATVTTIPYCHGLVFTTFDRPVPSKRGWSAAPVRHGVSTVRDGTRLTLGLVFHDAQ